MKKLKLLNLNSHEVLTRGQLKNVIAGNGYYCSASYSSGGTTYTQFSSGGFGSSGTGDSWCNFWNSAGYTECSCHYCSDCGGGGYGTIT